MKDQLYYVYSLAYPNGKIFYIGKGQGKRMYGHEDEARGLRKVYNQRKVDIILGIWANGGQVVKKILAYFQHEEDAYMCEYALINMTTYADKLANIARGHDSLVGRRNADPPIEVLQTPICITRGTRAGATTRHGITDIDAFCKQHGISRRKMRLMLSGEMKAYSGWRIVENCRCLPPEVAITPPEKPAKISQDKQVLSYKIQLPNIIEPICIRHKHSQGATCIYHQVTNAHEFLRNHSLRASTMKALLENGGTNSWDIIDCACCEKKSS